jgi:uncharacterized protein YyaL (SSP411 family)
VVRDLLTRAPTAFGHALGALDLYLSPAREVAIIGDPDDRATMPLVQEVWRRYLPNAVLAVARPDDADAAKAVALLADKTPLDGRPTAYVCERFVCRRPVTEATDLREQLDE